MKFYPSDDPRSPSCPADIKRHQESLRRVRKIATARAMGLHRIADALAQDKMDLKTEHRDKQLRLWE